MSTTSKADLYRCHWCSSINDSMKNEWCLCTTAQRTLVCSDCKRCFCAAPEAASRKFWELASASLVSRRWQASKPSASPEPAAPERGGPVLLVVDDVKTIHTVVDTILTPFFGTIVHSYNGADAFRIARTIRPDILLTDAMLPGLDGRDVVRLLKADPATASIKTVLMTGLYKGVRYRNEAFHTFHVDAYIEKPVGAAELRAVLAELLDKNMADALAS